MRLAHIKFVSLTAGLALSLGTLGACGSSSPATGDDDVTPTGTHYKYVIDTLSVPTSSTESRADGLDLTGDGVVDNQLGQVLGTLSQQGINAQASVTAGVDQGLIIILGDLQTSDATFTAATDTGFSAYIGDDPVPAACTSSADTVCRHQFTGTAMFGIDPASPTTNLVTGSIVAGTFTGGPGTISLQIALSAGNPIDLNLIGARVKFSGMSATGITNAVIAGAVPEADIDTKILPAVASQIATILTTTCTATPVGNDCGCPSGTSAATIISLFDTNHDCMVPESELQSNSLIMSLLAADVAFDNTTGKSVPLDPTTGAAPAGSTPGLSIGVAATFTGAMFTSP